MTQRFILVFGKTPDDAQLNIDEVLNATRNVLSVVRSVPSVSLWFRLIRDGSEITENE